MTAPARVLTDCPKCGSRKALSVLSGSWLARRRLELGLSQTAVAEQAEITQGTLSRLETQKQVASAPVAKRLGRVLGFEP